MLYPDPDAVPAQTNADNITPHGFANLGTNGNKETDEVTTDREEHSPGRQTSSPTIDLPTSPKEYSETQSRIPTEYEVRDEKFRTFSLAGEYEWSDTFLSALEQETGWTRVRKGNFTITIEYEDLFTQKAHQGAHVFVHAGSEVTIRVNEALCCCSGLITIPPGLSSPKLKDLKQLIQQEITLSFEHHQKIVIQQIKECLNGHDAS